MSDLVHQVLDLVTDEGLQTGTQVVKLARNDAATSAWRKIKNLFGAKRPDVVDEIDENGSANLADLVRAIEELARWREEDLRQIVDRSESSVMGTGNATGAGATVVAQGDIVGRDKHGGK